MAGSIKRELQVRFSTTGDGEVVRSIAKVDDGLKGVGDTSGAAGRSIGDLSESLDKGLENSVGRAFKATDRLNSIVGQVGGAIGLATLAVTAMATAYEFASKALNENTAAQKFANQVRNQATREIDAYLAAYAQMPGATAEQVAAHVKEAAATEAMNRRIAETAALLEAAKQARVGAAAALRSHNEDLKRGFENHIGMNKALNARAEAQRRVAQADVMVTRAAEAHAAANRTLAQTLDDVRQRQLRAAQASLVLEKAWSRFGGSAAKAGRGLLNVAVPGLTQVIDAVSNKKALADSEAFGKTLAEMLGLTYKSTAAIKANAAARVETTAQAQRRIRSMFAEVNEQMDRALGLQSTDEKIASFVNGLESLIPVAIDVGEQIRRALDFSPPDGGPGPLDEATEAAATFGEVFRDALEKAVGKEGAEVAISAIDSLATSMEGLARGTAEAAAASIWYGSSFADMAKEAVAAVAVQSTAEGLFQGAKALAFLAAGLFTGNAGAFLAAKTAAASSAAFLAIGAATGAVGKATGAFGGKAGGGGGSGVPAGPSSRDVGRSADSDGGAETIIINMGNQRLFATERDVGSAVTRSLNAASRGRGRPRIRRAALGGA